MMKKLCVAIAVISALFLTMLFFAGCSDRKMSRERLKKHELVIFVRDTEGNIPERYDIFIQRDQFAFGNRGDYMKLSDSSTKVILPAEGLWYINITSPDHDHLRFPVFADILEKNSAVNVTLKLHNYTKNIERMDIKYIYSKESYEMKNEGNGIFTYEVKESGDRKEFKYYYQVSGHLGGRILNGQDHDYIFSDDGGDYYSIIQVKDGYKKITYDVKVLHYSEEDLPAAVEYVNSEGNMKLVNIYERVFEIRSKLIHDYDIYKDFDEKGIKAYFLSIFDPVANYLWNCGTNGKDLVAKYAWTEYYYIYDEYRQVIDKERTDKIWEMLGPGNPFYSTKNGLMSGILRKLDRTDLILESRGRYYDRRTEGVEMAHLAHIIKKEDPDKFEELIKALIRDYCDYHRVNSLVKGSNAKDRTWNIISFLQT